MATSGSTFFRQISGTLGTAVLLSLLFTLVPLNLQTTFKDQQSLPDDLDAALDPTVASAPANAGIMSKVYDPFVAQLSDGVLDSAQQGVDQAKTAAADAVAAQVASGAIPAAVQQQATAEAEKQAIEQAAAKITAEVPVAQVAADGTVTLDFSDATARRSFVDQAVPQIIDGMSGSSGSSFDDSTMDDTSFLNGADPRLTKPLLVSFNQSTVSVYWVAMGVALIAFVLTLFFRTPPLRQKSALQESADAERQPEPIALG